MADWNQIWRRKGYSPEIPDRIVVNLVPLLEKRKATRILDLGCGAGRHIAYLSEQGFQAYGADLSETGLKLTKKRLKSRELEAEIIKCSMRSLPYIHSGVDAVICVRTIYHQKLKQIQESISEIHRVLTKKGLFLVDFHSRRSHKCGRGIMVEENTFVQESGPEKGILHHFVDENELHELLKNFRIVDLKVAEKMVGSHLQSYFIILASKT